MRIGENENLHNKGPFGFLASIRDFEPFRNDSEVFLKKGLTDQEDTAILFLELVGANQGAVMGRFFERYMLVKTNQKLTREEYDGTDLRTKLVDM